MNFLIIFAVSLCVELCFGQNMGGGGQALGRGGPSPGEHSGLTRDLQFGGAAVQGRVGEGLIPYGGYGFIDGWGPAGGWDDTIDPGFNIGYWQQPVPLPSWGWQDGWQTPPIAGWQVPSIGAGIAPVPLGLGGYYGLGGFGGLAEQRGIGGIKGLGGISGNIAGKGLGH